MCWRKLTAGLDRRYRNEGWFGGKLPLRYIGNESFQIILGKTWGGGVTRHSGKAGPAVIPGLQFFFISDILFLMIPARTERKFCVARAAKEENVRMAGLKEHIFLIGFMGCGKSTNAARLAEIRRS